MAASCVAREEPPFECPKLPSVSIQELISKCEAIALQNGFLKAYKAKPKVRIENNLKYNVYLAENQANKPAMNKKKKDIKQKSTANNNKKAKAFDPFAGPFRSGSHICDLGEKNKSIDAFYPFTETNTNSNQTFLYHHLQLNKLYNHRIAQINEHKNILKKQLQIVNTKCIQHIQHQQLAATAKSNAIKHILINYHDLNQKIDQKYAIYTARMLKQHEIIDLQICKMVQHFDNTHKLQSFSRRVQTLKNDLDDNKLNKLLTTNTNRCVATTNKKNKTKRRIIPTLLIENSNADSHDNDTSKSGKTDGQQHYDQFLNGLEWRVKNTDQYTEPAMEDDRLAKLKNLRATLKRKQSIIAAEESNKMIEMITELGIAANGKQPKINVVVFGYNTHIDVYHDIVRLVKMSQNERETALNALQHKHLQAIKVKIMSGPISRKDLMLKAIKAKMIELRNNLNEKNGTVSHENESVISKKDMLWTCGVCTFMNKPLANICEICGTLQSGLPTITDEQLAKQLQVSSNYDGSVLETTRKRKLKYDDTSAQPPNKKRKKNTK